MALKIDDGDNLIPAAPDYIGISRDGMNWDLIPKTNLKIGGFFNPNPIFTYPYHTQTMLTLESADVPRLDIELQSVVNQATWSTGTETALNLAKATIGGWIP